MILKLKDGILESVDLDKYSNEGCPTCDYRSEYFNDLTIRTTDYVMYYTIVNEHDYVLSLNDVILLFTQNLDLIKELTQKELYEYVAHFLQTLLEKKGYVDVPFDYEIHKKVY